MGKAQDFVSVAASQIGVKESPANSNNNKYGIWYGMNYQPWCDMFVSWCGDQIGATSIVGKFAYCPYHVNFFKQQGWWLSRDARPEPGDVIFFANKGTACHVGIVEKRNDSSSVTTIEGNTSTSSNDNGGAVMRRVRTYGNVGSSWYILGFGRPDWSQLDAVYPKPEQPIIRHNCVTAKFEDTSTGQKFWIRGNVEDGAEISIRNVENALWLSDPNGSTDSGTPAQFWEGINDNKDPKDAQKFILEGTGKPGIFRVHPKVAQHLSMDTNAGSTESGARIQFYTSNQTSAQSFYFYPITYDGNLYRIFSVTGFKPISIG